MTDDDVLRGIDAPRPLPEHVRAALEATLLGGDDAFGVLLRTAEAPRELPAPLRADLRNLLSRRRNLPASVVGAAAAAVLVAGAVVALPSSPEPAPTAQTPVASPGVQPSPEPAAAAGVGVQPPAAAVAAPPAPAVVAPAPSPRPAASAVDSTATGSGTAAGSAGGAPAAAAGPPRGVTAIAPDEGPVGGGTRITLTGDDLSRAVSVELDSRPGTDLVVESANRISVTTPAAPEPMRAFVQVRLSTGEVYLSPGGFTYLAAPSVTAVDPAAGPAAGGNVVVVTGSGFTARSTVAFGDARASKVEVMSETQLRVVAPAHLPGPVQLTVTTAGGTSNGVEYVYGA
jgi:hypothetical protein